MMIQKPNFTTVNITNLSVLLGQLFEYTKSVIIHEYWKFLKKCVLVKNQH